MFLPRVLSPIMCRSVSDCMIENVIKCCSFLQYAIHVQLSEFLRNKTKKNSYPYVIALYLLTKLPIYLNGAPCVFYRNIVVDGAFSSQELT